MQKRRRLKQTKESILIFCLETFRNSLIASLSNIYVDSLHRMVIEKYAESIMKEYFHSLSDFNFNKSFKLVKIYAT